MAFKIKKYPTKKARKLPLVGHGQGAKDITAGRMTSGGAGGGYSAPQDIEAPDAVVINGVLSGVIGAVTVINGVLTNE